MQALFYASALLFFEVCGLLIFALFIRGLVLDFALSLPIRGFSHTLSFVRQNTNISKNTSSISVQWKSLKH